MARVVSEAMAAGLPCIITNESGFTNILDDKNSAFYVDKNNVEQIYISLKEAILNPDRLNMLSKNCQSASKLWTWQKYQSSLKAVYENLIES